MPLLSFTKLNPGAWAGCPDVGGLGRVPWVWAAACIPRPGLGRAIAAALGARSWG